MYKINDNVNPITIFVDFLRINQYLHVVLLEKAMLSPLIFMGLAISKLPTRLTQCVVTAKFLVALKSLKLIISQASSMVSLLSV